MSRAFLKDNDGWSFCRAKNRECMLADPDGTCGIHHCRYERQPAEKGEDDKDTSDPETPLDGTGEMGYNHSNN